MPDFTLVFVFQCISLLGFGLNAAKLFRNGLYRRYRVLFACFIFHVPYIAFGISLNVSSKAYAFFWAITTALLWIFYILMILELCRLILEKYPGLYTLGRWAMYLFVMVAVTLSSWSFLSHLRIRQSPQSPIIGYIFAADRGVDLSLAIFLVLMLLFLSRYPVALTRNTITHAGVYTVYFLSNTMGVLLQAAFGLQIYDRLAPALTGISAACVVTWFFFLSPKGEEKRMNVTHLGPEHEQRVLHQLDSLNAALLKISRK